MGIQEANSAGFVHGGIVMKMCDEAAGIAAVKHSRCRVVTAAIDRMTFLHPVHIGQLLTCRARVNAAWRTSMEVGVRVEAENPRTRPGPPHQHRLPHDGRDRRRRRADHRAAAGRRDRTTSSGGSARRSYGVKTG